MITKKQYKKLFDQFDRDIETMKNKELKILEQRIHKGFERIKKDFYRKLGFYKRSASEVKKR